MKYILLFILLTSCGQTGKRCFSREEALLACQAQEIANKQVTADYARMLCEPYYQYGTCYSL